MADKASQAPADEFKRWTKAGLPHWSLTDDLPLFQSSVRTVSGSDQCHGRVAPEPIHQLQEDEISDVVRSVAIDPTVVMLAEHASHWMKG